MRKFLRAVLVAAFTLTLVGAPAQAETLAQMGQRVYEAKIATAANPSKAFAALSPTKRRAVKRYLTASTVTRVTVVRNRPGPSPMAGGCRDHTVTNTVRGPVDNVLLKFYQMASWCWNNGIITSVHATRWGTTHAIFWNYKGVYEKDAWGVGQTSGQVFGQGHFELCFYGDIGCVDSSNPWIRQRIYGNGTVTYSGGA